MQNLFGANAVPDRKRYLDELKKNIKAKGQEAGDKRRKLDPTNSGDSPSAINGNVEHASEDIVQERIKRKGQPASFKRGPNFEAPNAEGQGSKIRKKGNAVHLQPDRGGGSSMTYLASTFKVDLRCDE